MSRTRRNRGPEIDNDATAVLANEKIMRPPMVRKTVPSSGHVERMTRALRAASFAKRCQMLLSWIHAWPQLALEVIYQEALEKRREARMAMKLRNVAARALMPPKARAKRAAASRPAVRRRILKSRKKAAAERSPASRSVLAMLTQPRAGAA